MKTVAETLGVARSNLHDKVRQAAKPRASYRKPDDDYLLPLVRRLIGERPTYGYRRITALANRELGRTGEPVINHKRMFRIMRQNGMLLARHTGRRNGRLHDGKVVVMGSNLRWCSDGFGTATSSAFPSSSMLMTARSLPGTRSQTPALAAVWFAT
jgi:hypothetical protein